MSAGTQPDPTASARPGFAVGLFGGIAITLVLALTLGTLVAVVFRAEHLGQITTSDLSAIRFTLVQALLSAVLSVGFAIPVARALARRRFRGRAFLITLLGAPFILPVIVAIFGLLAVFGHSGILGRLLSGFGLESWRIYGLHGVILAHVFFNLPLATRLILQGWLSIPAERLRLAAALGFGPGDTRRILEWPMLKAVVPGAVLVIFLICTTSFAVALTLGGGPRATTIELAIYQAFRFEFDLGKAAQLALIQFAVGLGAALLAWRVSVPMAMGAGLDRPMTFFGVNQAWRRALDVTLITIAALFLIGPMVMIVIKGLPNVLSLPAPVFWSFGRSLLVALCSTALTLVLALAIGSLAIRLPGSRRALAESVGYLAISASPLVVGTGLFILVFPYVDPSAIALAVTAFVNAVMALPFALRALLPALTQVEKDFGRLASSLSLSGWRKFRVLILPCLRRPLGFSAGLAAALSMGDLGVIALFADPNEATLPLQLYRLMSAYRTMDAAGAALLLLVGSLMLFWVFDRGGRVNADG